jgi:L,D-peptidoglycan transpeptidase YkuD (ErfK/YbiS/YcfS/YnhG family)
LLLILCLSILPVAALGKGPDVESAPPSPIRASQRQMLLVRSASWHSATGTLERYERHDGSWHAVGSPVPVDLGRSGMAWGRGLHPSIHQGPHKREGDGKSPAGVYPLGTAFGVAESLPNGSRGFPYLHARASSYCVEDTRSEHYNELVDSREVSPHGWERWSELVRNDGLFDWALVVRQNARDTQKGAGSCVFLHIWRGPKRPTSGCTAMAEDALETILRWLDPKQKPVLVQLPEPAFRAVEKDWGLP